MTLGWSAMITCTLIGMFVSGVTPLLATLRDKLIAA
jgi:hypothetical protein